MKVGAFSVTLIESPDIKIIGVGEGDVADDAGLFAGADGRIGDRTLQAVRWPAFKQGGKFAGWTTGAVG